MRKRVLRTCAVLMALSSAAFVVNSFFGSHWNLLAAPLYLALAVMFWRSARRADGSGQDEPSPHQ